MLDIDHFKEVNDMYGHDAGDAVLRAFATTAQHLRQGSDVLCRYGGDEFIMVLSEAPLDQGLARLEEIHRSIGELKVKVRGQVLLRVTASVGVAVFPDNGTNVDSLITAADVALYRAKTKGRNCIVVSDAVAADTEAAPS